MAQIVPTERIYRLSLGSQQDNAHVHWHVAALPPGTPYASQQHAALAIERAGALNLSPAGQRDLASRLLSTIDREGQGSTEARQT
jgi:histidine triad (HIT) family protein/ATP adenylyltransferase